MYNNTKEKLDIITRISFEIDTHHIDIFYLKNYTQFSSMTLFLKKLDILFLLLEWIMHNFLIAKQEK